jgi:hypothetical protein
MTNEKPSYHPGVVDLETPQVPPKVPTLRLFIVSGSDGDVMVEAHGFDMRDGCLQFFVLAVEAIDGQWAVVQYTRRAFKKWRDVEEVSQRPTRSVN